MTTFLKQVWWALTVNNVTTDGEPPYPDLSSICTSASVEHIWNVVQSTFENHPNWTIESIDRSNRELKATARTQYLRITDDLKIWIDNPSDLDGYPRIYAQSASRIGKGDLGFNARRLRTLMEELRDELPCHKESQ